MVIAPARNVYVDAFLAAVPTAFLRDALDLIFKAYRDALSECEKAFDESEAHDVRPIFRRGLIEQDLKAAAERHGFQGRSVLNSTHSNYHTEVTIGSVVITENTLTAPNEMVKDAGFRNGLALEYQIPLGLYGESAETSHEKSIYAVIISGQNRKNPALPAFVHVVFPSTDCKHYMGRVDLIKHLEQLGVVSGNAAATVSAPTVSAKDKPVRGIAKV